ncbi:MAG: hypothetical protein ACRECL_17960 [Bradyrhizobium sp.]
MEVEGASYLYTLATLMITFAGFSALLLGIRQAAGARLSLLDRFLAKTVLVQLFTLTAGALLPPLLSLFNVSQMWLWPIAAVCFALPMLALLLSYPRRRRKTIGRPPPPIVLAVFVALGSTAIAVMLICVLGGFAYKAGAYVAALTINFFTTAFAFVAALDVIMQQPLKSSAVEHQK